MSETPPAGAANVLMLCSANQCRSPMAAALLTRRLGALATPLVVRSAGLLGGGEPPPPRAITALAPYGLDISGHRSHQMTEADLARADLVLGMSREHVRHAVVTVPGAWPRAFTLKELVRRGEEAGPAKPGELLAGWLARVHEGRDHAALLGASPVDDVADPIGGPLRAYADTASQLDELISRLARLCWRLPADSLPGQP